jgi:hypothetical protein
MVFIASPMTMSKTHLRLFRSEDNHLRPSDGALYVSRRVKLNTVNNKIMTTAVYLALTWVIGSSLGAAGCAIWTPADTTQTEQSRSSTTTTTQDMPVNTTRTTSVRSSTSTN